MGVSLLYGVFFCNATKASRFGHVSRWQTSAFGQVSSWPTAKELVSNLKLTVCHLKNQELEGEHVLLGWPIFPGYVTFRVGTVWELGNQLPWLSGVISGQKHLGAKAPFLFYVEWNLVKLAKEFEDLPWIHIQANFRQLSIWFYLFNGFFPILFSKRKIRHVVFQSSWYPIQSLDFFPRNLFNKLLEFAASFWGSDFGCFVANVWASRLHLERSTWCATAGHSCHTAKEEVSCYTRGH